MTRTFAPLLLALALVVAPGCDSSGIGNRIAALELVFGCDITELAIGQGVTGRLATSDCDDEDLLDGEFADASGDFYTDLYAFEVESDTDVSVALSSDAFDAVVGLFRETGTFIDTDDDSGTGFNALLEASLTPGLYVIIATSFDTGETGAYTLDLDRGTSVSLRQAAPSAEPKTATAWPSR